MNDAHSAPNAQPFHDIDETLAQWRQTLETATTNLLDLNESPIRKHLARRDLTPTLSGQTGPQVEAALGAISEIFQGFSSLSDTIERARDLRRAPSWPWQSEERRREIHHLLFEPSIEMGFDATPLSRRGLLSAPGQTRRVTPDELMAAMTSEFEVARDILERVERAWSELPLELSALESQIATILAPNSGATAEIVAISADIQTLREMLMVDPLGAAQVWPKLQLRGEAVQAQIEAASRRARESGESLSRAAAVLSELNTFHSRAEDAWAEAQLLVRTAVIAPARMPLPAAQIADLADWLETLQATVAAGRSEAARVGLLRWHEAAARDLEHEKLALEANGALLRGREELRGLFNALAAKSRALAARGISLDASLESAAVEAKSLLKSRPMPLSRVVELVAQFEAGLAAASAAANRR